MPNAPIFYIYGEVQRLGAYRIEPEISEVKALSIGSGLTLRGTESGIVIIRKYGRSALLEIDLELSVVLLYN